MLSRHRRPRDHRRRRWWPTAAVLTVITGMLGAGAVAASADATVDWASCQNAASGSLSLSIARVNWLDQTTATWSTSLPDACGQSPTLVLREARLDEDNPQTVPVARVHGSNGSLGFAPLRSSKWALRLIGPMGAKDLAWVDVTVDQPVGPLPDGPRIAFITANTVDQRRLFVRAVGTPGEVVKVAGNVELDLSGLSEVIVAPGVRILGQLDAATPLGPRLFTSSAPRTLFSLGIQSQFSDDIRISGIRLDGGQGTASAPGDFHTTDGIKIWSGNHIEIDHNELYGWRGAAVSVNDPQGRLASAQSNLVRVHDNWIHHNQRWGGNGYGVEVNLGAWALIDQNYFDNNRHAIAGDGRPGSGYTALRNVVGHGGGEEFDLLVKTVYTHSFDMHGREDCFKISYYCGDAGEGMDIEYNTFFYSNGTDIKVRGNPSGVVTVAHNAFSFDTSRMFNVLPGGLPEVDNAAMVQTTDLNHGKIKASDNQFGLSELLVVVNPPKCDFDGDGVGDPFYATGVTWWYGSSRMAGRWVYLNTSTVRASQVVLKDLNGDGLCDLASSGGVLYNPSAGSEFAFSANGTGQVWTVNRNDSFQIAPPPLAAGTSPAVAADGKGGWEIALHGTNHHLWTVDSTGVVLDTGLGMPTWATSPAIVALPGGGYEVIYVGSDGYLAKLNPTYTDARWVGAGLGVAPGTSPSVDISPSGIWKVAFHAIGDHLWTADLNDTVVDTGLAMAKGANSPAIVANVSVGFDIVFVGADDYLTKLNATLTDVRWVGAGLGVAPGTSPAIDMDSSGVWRVAFHAVGDHLWIADRNDWVMDTGLALAKGTNSPAIQAQSGGGYEIAYVGADGYLAKRNPSGTDARWVGAGLGVAAGSSPVIISPWPALH